LDVCEAAVKGCWSLLEHNGYGVADAILTACMSELESLATHLSPCRKWAASLVVETKVTCVIILTA